MGFTLGTTVQSRHAAQDRQEPNFVDYTPPDHGRIEIRKIWTTTELNHYLNFPYVGQAFVIERQSLLPQNTVGF